MSRDMTRATLEMLYKLEDFREIALAADDVLKQEAPESSRGGLTRVQSKRIELGNILGCVAALQNSIRVYRGSGQQAKAG